ncbi:hypothetical protein [Pseudomonas nicosulfuronedens]
MATLEQRRRASGAVNAAARRGIGAANEAARRAGGASMEAQRRGTSVIDDLNSVVVPVQQGRQLPTIEARGSRPAARGVADYQAPAAGKGGGIASPLTVQSVTYAEQPQWVETVDGSGLFRVKTISSIQMVDADGNPVVISGFGTAVSTGGE